MMKASTKDKANGRRDLWHGEGDARPVTIKCHEMQMQFMQKQQGKNLATTRTKEEYEEVLWVDLL